MMRTLIIGGGEIGQAMKEVLEPYYEVFMRDVMAPPVWDGKYPYPEIMHICFPYSPGFVGDVRDYQREYQPRLTVIHSTVPVGTTAKCWVDNSKPGSVHSPIRGMHPNLVGGIKTFVKFVGGPSPAVDEVAEYFRRAGVRVFVCRSSSTTELAKIADTSFYSVCIEFIKELDRICGKHGVPFSEAFTLFQQTYNEGWTLLGRSEYCRPVLVPIQQKQGGHCTLPNLEFYGDSHFADLVKLLNGSMPDKEISHG
jgi:hypothetical protein